MKYLSISLKYISITSDGLWEHSGYFLPNSAHYGLPVLHFSPEGNSVRRPPGDFGIVSRLRDIILSKTFTTSCSQWFCKRTDVNALPYK